jgi:hypothetical protein
MPVGDGEAPVVDEFKYLGSMLSKNFDDSVTIMARIRLARIAFTKLQKAIFGTVTTRRRVALESKKIAYVSLVPVLSLLLYGSECWVVNAGNMRLLPSHWQRFHRKCIRIMCRVTRQMSHSESEASHLRVDSDRGTGGEAASGHPRHQALCSFELEGAEPGILRARFSYGRSLRLPFLSGVSLRTG